MAKTTLSGVTLGILCGGLAQRLGSDKGLYRATNGETLLQRALRLWSPMFEQVIVVVRSNEQRDCYLNAIPELLQWCEIVCDPGSETRSALTGIATAVARTNTQYVLTTAVDQLALTAELFAILAANPGNKACAFRLPNLDIVPLPSLWPRDKRDYLRKLLEQRQFGVQRALHSCGVTLLDGSSFAKELSFNGNTKHELDVFLGEPLATI